MTEKEYAQVIAKNLKRIAYERDKTQAQIAQDLKIHKATISAWMNGTRTPKMSKIDMLCKYFQCKRSDIMEPHADVPRTDYIVRNKEMERLIEIATKSTTENIHLAVELLARMGK